ncbi:MAG: hypothetical protein M1834_007296 [Cirrosporium novae-zelandiae]|nr:MAG: hypothetical protein M1834_007296 [Cirrosporium novae-zelandiae]
MDVVPDLPELEKVMDELVPVDSVPLKLDTKEVPVADTSVLGVELRGVLIVFELYVVPPLLRLNDEDKLKALVPGNELEGDVILELEPELAERDDVNELEFPIELDDNE